MTTPTPNSMPTTRTGGPAPAAANPTTDPPNPAARPDPAATPEQRAAAPDDTTGAPANDDPREGENTRGGAGEAARYRRQLRDAEAERDGLREQLAGWQRREVERLATDLLAVPGDVFDLGGVDLGDLLDEHGQVDEVAVLDAVTGLLDTRPGLGRVEPRRTAPSNQGAGYRAGARGTESSWAEALRGR